jgi:hypothetical protein
VNANATSISKLGIFALATFACLTVGCAADVVGTGDVRRVDPARTNGGGDDESSGSGAGSADGTGTSGGSGVPAEVEALFAPPEDDTVTPDSIFGVWASVSTITEDRLKITQNSVTLARRCTTDGRIAHVAAKIRANAGTITVLESKSANLTGACNSHLRLEVEEWQLCASYGCIWVEGTKMTGLVLPGTYSETSWIKLSD